jgi:hypothetical protein
MGSVYQPKLKSGGMSTRWWIKCYVDGRVMLDGAVTSGQPVMPNVDRLRPGEAAAYQATGCRNLKQAGKRLAHRDPFFTGRRVAAITWHKTQSVSTATTSWRRRTLKAAAARMAARRRHVPRHVRPAAVDSRAQRTGTVAQRDKALRDARDLLAARGAANWDSSSQRTETCRRSEAAARSVTPK